MQLLLQLQFQVLPSVRSPVHLLRWLVLPVMVQQGEEETAMQIAIWNYPIEISFSNSIIVLRPLFPNPELAPGRILLIA